MTRSRIYDVQVFGLVMAIGGAVFLFNGNADAGRGYQTAERFSVQEIDAGAAKQLMEAGAIFIDVRPRSAFDAAHIDGALPLPLQELRTSLPDRASIDRAQPIVIYCGDGAGSGPEGTFIMNQAGFSGAVHLKGGIDSWTRAGLPVG